jgi:hypothetical protein
MALTDKLRDLDQKLLPGTREPDEDAETYLRRVAAGRAISPAQAGDVMAALRVYFDVQPDAGDGDEEQKKSGGEEEDEGTESKDESREESDQESDEEGSGEKPEDGS